MDITEEALIERVARALLTVHAPKPGGFGEHEPVICWVPEECDYDALELDWRSGYEGCPITKEGLLALARCAVQVCSQPALALRCPEKPPLFTLPSRQR